MQFIFLVNEWAEIIVSYLAYMALTSRKFCILGYF